MVDDPPLALKEGGIFRDGYDVDLDALRQASREGKDWISQLQEREIASHRHQIAQSALQLGLRLFHRGRRSRIWRTCLRITRANKQRSVASVSSRQN